jgi:hypothetical protein
MNSKTYELHGLRVLECTADGPVLRTVGDALAVLAEAMQHDAGFIVLPSARLDPGFFQLRTGLAGEIVQKFVNYRRRLAILGDFSELTAESKSLRDFIYESNRGNALWFLSDIAEVERRLASAG